MDSHPWISIVRSLQARDLRTIRSCIARIGCSLGKRKFTRHLSFVLVPSTLSKAWSHAEGLWIEFLVWHQRIHSGHETTMTKMEMMMFVDFRKGTLRSIPEALVSCSRDVRLEIPTRCIV